MYENELPRIVQDCITNLRVSENLQRPGLFRKVPRLLYLDQLRDAYNRGHPIALSSWPDSAILSCSLLKLYLRSLPIPVVPSSLYDSIKRCPQKGEEAVNYIREQLLPALADHHPEGECVNKLLRELMSLLHEISQISGTSSLTASPVKAHFPFTFHRNKQDERLQFVNSHCSGSGAIT